tara:strand:- start:3517 stop:4548 length:1032 start_codon:yes stop_codon:yes gene_type:complete
MSTIRVFDAFSGIGGFRAGVEGAMSNERKFKFVAASDSDQLCKDFYERFYNTSNERFFDDIEKVHTSSNKTQKILPDFDLLLGGFPCQPFANIGKLGGLNDNRGTLIFRICDMLKFYQPKYFILENVQKIRNLGKGQTLEAIKDLLKQAGYSICLWDLCASDYGVPQQRRRMIFCGVKDIRPSEVYLSLPKKIDIEKCRYKTTWHLLEKSMPKEHIVPARTAETVFRRNIKWQGDMDINRLIARPLTATMAKWHRSNQDNYFSEDFVLAKDFEKASLAMPNPNGKPVRRITLLEGLRLQGFEDEAYHIFRDMQIKPTAGFRLIGNAIPVPMVTAITNAFFEAI